MPGKGYKKYKCDECGNEDFCHWIERNRAARIRCTKCGSAKMNLMSRKAQKEAVEANRNAVLGVRSTQKPCEQSPKIWISDDDRFEIIQCDEKTYIALDWTKVKKSGELPSYTAAVNWIRKKAQQESRHGD